MKNFKITFIIFAFFILFSLFFAHNSFAISIPNEKKLGKKFMEMVKKQDMILNDPIVDHMVTKAGNHILSFLPPQPFEFSFYVINDDIFNAFASPGANIFVYRGLITSLDSIDELAGIIAHEIAHAASRHVSESIDRAKYINIGSLAGILAGIVIGSQSEKSDAGTAIMQSSIAAGHTAMLAFTRDNETEADEKGIMFLKKSCFSPKGLEISLMKIRDLDFQGIEKIPDYVKTHPGTGKRIAHVGTILTDYNTSSLKEKTMCRDFRFNMVKHRLLGLYADIKPTFNQLKTQLEKDFLNPCLHYGLALIYDRKFMTQKALFHLEKALSINAFDPMILLEIGRIHLFDKNFIKAVNILKNIQSDPVIGIMAQYYLAKAYLEMNDFKLAKQYLEKVIKQKPFLYPGAYFDMANIMLKENNSGFSSFYLGQYYYQIKNYKNAKFHFTKALKTLKNPDLIKKSKKFLQKAKTANAKKHSI